MKHKKYFKLKLIAVVLAVLLLLPSMAAHADEPSWTALTSMSYARYCFQTEVIDGKIYAIGGIDESQYLSSAEEYDPVTDTWTTLAPMSTARGYFQTEVIDGEIYAIGGTSGLELSSVEVYDPGTNTWTTLSSMSRDRVYFQTEVSGGKIYAFGGLMGQYDSSAEVYDPSTNTWTTLPSMSEARAFFQTKEIDGKIYVIGGQNDNGVISSAEAFDPATNTWTTLNPMIETRMDFQTEVFDGEIYAVGGYSRSSAEKFDPVTGTWTTLAPLSTTRELFRTEEINGNIYAMGGYGQSSAEVYDPGINTWTTISSMSTVRYNFQTEVIDETIYAIGGQMLGANNVLSSVECYSPGSGGTIPDAPANLTAAAGDTQVSLTWDSASGATNYTIMRAAIQGGPYAAIAADVTETAYTDTDVTNGITYYYVVVAVNDDGESTYSNEASATPAAPACTVLLRITMVTGEIKEYEMDSTQTGDFLSWCAGEGAGNPVYEIEKNYNLGPFSARTEYIVYEKISSFEVLQY